MTKNPNAFDFDSVGEGVEARYGGNGIRGQEMRRRKKSPGFIRSVSDALGPFLDPRRGGWKEGADGAIGRRGRNGKHQRKI